MSTLIVAVKVVVVFVLMCINPRTHACFAVVIKYTVKKVMAIVLLKFVRVHNNLGLSFDDDFTIS